MTHSPPMLPDEAGPGDRLGLVSPMRALRLLGLLESTLDELGRTPIDEPARRRLVAWHQVALTEVASTVADALTEEMVRLHMEPLAPDASPAQIRQAQVQLLGWLTGLIASGGLVSGAPMGAGAWSFEAPALDDAPRR